MRAYYLEVWKIAIKEVNAFWSAHRIATSIPSPLIGFVASAVVNKGLLSLIALKQAIEISLLSGVAGYCVTLLVSFVRAPKLLNDQRLSQIEKLNADNREIRENLNTESSELRGQIKDLTLPKRTPAEERIYREVAEALKRLDELRPHMDVRGILRHLLNSEPLTIKASGHLPPLPNGISADHFKACMNLCATEFLIVPEQSENRSHGIMPAYDYSYRIASGKRPALLELLYSDEQ